MSAELPQKSPVVQEYVLALSQTIGPKPPEGDPVTLSDLDRSLGFIQTAGDVLEHLIEQGIVEEARLTEHLAGEK